MKEKYKKELEEWENLSKTLKEMQEKALIFNLKQERSKLKKTEEEQRTASFSGKEKKDKDNASSSLVDELLLQVNYWKSFLLIFNLTCFLICFG